MARQDHLDSIYRQMFGMKPYEDGTREELESRGIIDARDMHHDIPIIQLVMGDDHRYGCGYSLSDQYAELYTDKDKPDEVKAYACANAHHEQYYSLSQFVLSFIARNNANIVLIDLANMGAGNLSEYQYNLDALPMVYRDRPILNLAILPQRVIEHVTFRHNKIIIPIVCLYYDVEKNRTRQCRGQSDDYLLALMYQDIAEVFPDNVFVLSGDQYRWRGVDKRFTYPINYVKLVRKPQGESIFTMQSNDGHINRRSAFGVPVHDSEFDPNPPDTDMDLDSGAAPMGPADLADLHINPIRKNAIGTKWRLCDATVKGEICPYGKKCTFAHGREQLQEQYRNIKQTPCMKGLECTYGHKCKFLHPQRGQTYVP